MKELSPSLHLGFYASWSYGHTVPDKNLLFADSQPGMGAVCTMGIPDTAASVEVSPPGFVYTISLAFI